MTQLVAFVLTLMLELPAAAFYRWARRLELSVSRLLIACVIGTSITHPIVWLLVSKWLPWPYWSRIAVAEPFAVIVEAAIFIAAARVEVRDALVLALFINAFSFSLGYLLSAQIFDLVRALS